MYRAGIESVEWSALPAQPGTPPCPDQPAVAVVGTMPLSFQGIICNAATAPIFATVARLASPAGWSPELPTQQSSS